MSTRRKKRVKVLPMSHPRGKERGYILLEVLVSLVVLAIGLLGANAMLGMSHNNSASSYSLTQANSYGANFLDSVRSNREALVRQQASLPSGSLPSCNFSALAAPSYGSPQAVINADIARFACEVQGGLPNGKASIVVDKIDNVSGGNKSGSRRVTVNITWDEMRRNTDKTNTAGSVPVTQTLELSSYI